MDTGRKSLRDGIKYPVVRCAHHRMVHERAGAPQRSETQFELYRGPFRNGAYSRNAVVFMKCSTKPNR
jgi:hypothetical protein